MIRSGALPHRITIERYTLGASDRYGNTERALTSTLTNVPARVDPVAASELLDRADQAVDVYLVILRPDVTIDAEDRILHGDLILEVDGPPKRFDTTRAHHQELTAHRIRG